MMHVSMELPKPLPTITLSLDTPSGGEDSEFLGVFFDDQRVCKDHVNKATRTSHIASTYVLSGTHVWVFFPETFARIEKTR